MGVFDNCIQYVLDNEGGYSNVPGDSGGPTNYGITQADLSQYMKRSASVADVKQISLYTAKQIYYSNYWMAMELDKITSDVICTCILDTGVNQGIGVAIKFAQYAVNNRGGSLIVDGHNGELTEAGINAIDPDTFIKIYQLCVINRYNNIVMNNPSQSVFLAGWTNRANRLLTLVKS